MMPAPESFTRLMDDSEGRRSLLKLLLWGINRRLNNNEGQLCVGQRMSRVIRWSSDDVDGETSYRLRGHHRRSSRHHHRRRLRSQKIDNGGRTWRGGARTDRTDRTDRTPAAGRGVSTPRAFRVAVWDSSDIRGNRRLSGGR